MTANSVHDLKLPYPWTQSETSPALDLYTADQMREAIKQAVEAEQTIWEVRLKFTAERWGIECTSQVEIECEACAEVAERGFRYAKDGCQIADDIRARRQA